jgi:hypothetical protein
MIYMYEINKAFRVIGSLKAIGGCFSENSRVKNGTNEINQGQAKRRKGTNGGEIVESYSHFQGNPAIS